MSKSGVGSCVHFCLRSLGLLGRCDHFFYFVQFRDACADRGQYINPDKEKRKRQQQDGIDDVSDSRPTDETRVVTFQVFGTFDIHACLQETKTNLIPQ